MRFGVDEHLELRNVDATAPWFEVRVGSWFGVLILTAINGGSVFQAVDDGACLRFESGCRYEVRRPVNAA